MKTTSYELYRTRQSTIAKTAKEFFKHSDPALLKLMKKHPENQITRYLLLGNQKQIQSLDSMIIAEELLWEREGCPVIFPQSAEFLDKLLDAQFDLSKAGGFELPFPAFMIPMPVGYEREGVKIRGILVTSYRVGEVNELLKHFADYLNKNPDPKLCKAFGVTSAHEVWFGDEASNLVKKGLYQDDQLLNICLVDSKDNLMEQATIRASEVYRRIPDLLQAKNYQEFDERLGHIDVSYRTQQIEKEDAIAEFYAFKIVCALAVYNQATDGAMLQAGMPGGKARVLGKLGNTQNYSMTYAAAQREGDSPSAHYRQWHFRQLRDERYYQGKHQNRPIGSRWTFVRDTLVNSKKTEPHTAVEVTKS